MYRVSGRASSLLSGYRNLRSTRAAECLPFALARCSSSSGKFSMDQLLPAPDAFVRRHIGPDAGEQKEMLKYLGLEVSKLIISVRVCLCCSHCDMKPYLFRTWRNWLKELCRLRLDFEKKWSLMPQWVSTLYNYSHSIWEILGQIIKS